MKIADQYNMSQLLRRSARSGCLQRFITLPSRRGYVRARPSDDDSGQRILTG